MSQATVAIPIPSERRGVAKLTGAVSDSLAMTWRNVITLRRVPQLLVFSTVQPVIFVVLFVYVFGGAVGNATGLPYIDFLVPGIFVQMSVFGAMGTAIGLASDVKSGLLERFHALPMARSAVLAGRTSADVVRNVFVILPSQRCRVSDGVPGAHRLAGVPWRHRARASIRILALLGVRRRGARGEGSRDRAGRSVPDHGAAGLRLTVFVPASLMASWLQPFAEHQPVSVTASAARSLMMGTPNNGYILQSLLWIIGIIAVAAPLAVRRYRQAI